MSPLAWIIMIVSVTFVCVLMVWCFARVLRAPEAVPEEMKDFHNA
jgi:hypothetical protein